MKKVLNFIGISHPGTQLGGLKSVSRKATTWGRSPLPSYFTQNYAVVSSFEHVTLFELTFRYSLLLPPVIQLPGPNVALVITMDPLRRSNLVSLFGDSAAILKKYRAREEARNLPDQA